MIDRTIFAKEEMQYFLTEIRLATPGGKIYKDQERKFEQIIAFVEQIDCILQKRSAKHTYHLLDCGCGNGYLSFVLWKYYKMMYPEYRLKILCVDIRKDLITQCNASCHKLNCSDDICFVEGPISSINVSKMDFVYSLHACDQATDQTIQKGIECRAKYIITVSCCPHTIRKQIENQDLEPIIRYKPFKERFISILADSMRALYLEMNGYFCDIFEFVNTSYTEKNVMIRAHFISNKNSKSARQYKILQDKFNVVLPYTLISNKGNDNV